MKKIIDARGDMCPIPVVKVKKALERLKQGSIEIYVDNEIAVQNLEKLAIQKKIMFQKEQEDATTYRAVFLKDGVDESSQTETGILRKGNCNDKMIVISSSYMGNGDDVLGTILMKGYLYALTQQEDRSFTILFYNGGVKLTVDGSACLADLQILQEQGVAIMTCGTCLHHYHLEDKLCVGSVTNMYEIVEKQMKASSVIKV